MEQDVLRKKTGLIILAILAIGGCADAPPANPYHSFQSDTALADSRLSRSLADEMLRVLYSQHQAWRGAPYQLGGLSKRGVDCSGFVYLTFRDRLGITLPRSTETLSHEGLSVPFSQLEPGDLVFFHTGRSRHVGIYLEQGRFLHVSTRSGVRISSLNSDYWSHAYWRARRIQGLSHQLMANLK